MSAPITIAVLPVAMLCAAIGIYRTDRTVLPAVLATTALVIAAGAYVAVLFAL